MPDLTILFEDNHLIAVAKPSGLLVQSDDPGTPSLEAAVREHIRVRDKKPGNVYLANLHRLDRPVSGIVLFAKTSKAAERLAREFRERKVEKQYLAVVMGRPARPSATLQHHLLRDTARRLTLVVPPETAGARLAILDYAVLAAPPPLALPATGIVTTLEVRPETGRSHQIRAQLAAVGHPILGDRKYGAPEALPDGQIALFATGLTFTHPTKKERVTVRFDPRGLRSPAGVDSAG